MDDIAFALVLNVHQPQGNLDDLLSNEPWAAARSSMLSTASRDRCGPTRTSAASTCRSPGRCWRPLRTPASRHAYGIVDCGSLLW